MKTTRCEIEYSNLGLIEYGACWQMQERLFKEAIEHKLKPGTYALNRVLFCQHPHVYTLGKSGKASNLLVQEAELTARGATLFHTNRGGDITYHGPGQMVGYPILDLDQFGLGIKSYVYQLEDVIIRTLKDFKIVGERKEGATGIWLDAENPAKARKICAIGIRASRNVTMHGFALNVNTNLDYFQLINPCGFTSGQVASMQRELQEKVDWIKVQKKFIGYMKQIFEKSKPCLDENI